MCPSHGGDAGTGPFTPTPPPPSLPGFGWKMPDHGRRKNVYRDEGVILSHTCWGPGGPPLQPATDSPPQTQPPPPPPPALKLAGKWEGVGVWPVATSPPWPQPQHFYWCMHLVDHR